MNPWERRKMKGDKEEISFCWRVMKGLREGRVVADRFTEVHFENHVVYGREDEPEGRGRRAGERDEGNEGRARKA